MAPRDRRATDVGPPIHERVLDRSALTVSRLRRSRVARRLGVRRSVAVVVAVSVGWTVATTVDRARHDRERWGSTRTVVVATEDVAAGGALDAGNTELVDRPSAMLPAGVLDELPTGRRASVPVAAGEPIVGDRLADASLGELAARLPEGTAGVTLPRTEVQPVLEVGDRIDVYATVSDVTGSASAKVADAATVVHVAPQAVTIAVAEDDVTDAAAASLSPGVAIVVLG